MGAGLGLLTGVFAASAAAKAGAKIGGFVAGKVAGKQNSDRAKHLETAFGPQLGTSEVKNIN